MPGFHFLRRFLSTNKPLTFQLEHLLGFTPRHLPYYEAALMHSSVLGEIDKNNERLEFLGDAILGAIVGEYLFRKYPMQDEGFLTELRSRIVRRETLNQVAMRMGLEKMVRYNQNDKTLGRSHIFGNALEALIGAVYLDKGFVQTQRFILKQLLRAYVDVNTLEQTDTNYKNKLLSWAQKNGSAITFDTLEEKSDGARKVFTVAIMMDGKEICTGTGYNKKEAGQAAAQKAMDVFDIT